MLVLYPGTDTARQEVFITPTPPIAGAATLPSGYKTLAVTVPATPYARVKFGYDASFHCTTDADSCVTGGTPWSYLREAPAPTSCVSGCTVDVQAIRERCSTTSSNRPIHRARSGPPCPPRWQFPDRRIVLFEGTEAVLTWGQLRLQLQPSAAGVPPDLLDEYLHQI